MCVCGLGIYEEDNASSGWNSVSGRRGWPLASAALWRGWVSRPGDVMNEHVHMLLAVVDNNAAAAAGELWPAELIVRLRRLGASTLTDGKSIGVDWDGRIASPTAVAASHRRAAGCIVAVYARQITTVAPHHSDFSAQCYASAVMGHVSVCYKSEFY